MDNFYYDMEDKNNHPYMNKEYTYEYAIHNSKSAIFYIFDDIVYDIAESANIDKILKGIGAYVNFVKNYMYGDDNKEDAYIQYDEISTHEATQFIRNPTNG
ncbi:hypothetical protein PFDG_05160 [Plasmodium falciparum Dd2]|uniref:Uncharacterized protein n=1 Tax=Plasmodium falciparum (isolate Dd2) TaxID=57267 RepID=A0A0L7M9R1_PLAF4|nr:hypothetical protein PFDG_05160 [Plasmodium falciparum Dd2]